MDKYTYEQAFNDSVKYFNGDELAAKVFLDKYALKNLEGELLENSPEKMHRRIAKELARVESTKFKNPLSEEFIFGLLDKFKFIIPQGSPMFGIGNNYQLSSLSNCYVAEAPLDAYASILKTDQQLAQISKRRGGVGVDISNLRPKGSITRNAAKTSTGIVSWMERYSNTIREVGQCIEENQRVLTKRGLVAIKNIVPNKDEVWTKIGWVKITNLVKNGSKSIYKTTSVSGYEVLTSEDHIFQTSFDGNLTETRLKDLKVGYGIVLCSGNPNQKKEYVKLNKSGYKNSNNKPDNCILPDILDEKLAYVLGFSYGDGSVDTNSHGDLALDLACSNDYPEIKDKLDKYTKDIFQYSINYRIGDGDLERLSINNKTIIDFLKFNKILKGKAEDLYFPEAIVNSPTSVQMSFLSGYFDADGYASGKKKGYCFASVDTKFIKECQKLLLSAGIVSKIHVEDRHDKGWQNLNSLVIVGKSAQEKFVNLFTESEKVQKLNHISKRDCWLSPFKAKSFGIKHNKYSYCPDNTQNLSVSIIERLKKEGENVCENLIYDEIRSITLEKISDTYDIVLEKEHLFWCEGFYLHNSGRRGALMQTISVHHPDVVEFATVKNDNTKVTGANISVKLTNEFLTALKEDKEYELRFPIDYKKKNIKPMISKMVKAKDIWKIIIHSAWMRAEPGLLFWDNILDYNAIDCYADEGFNTTCVNPCAELPLCEFDSCRLLVQNLYSYIKNPFTAQSQFDFDLFKEHSIIAQRLMDDIIDLEIEKIDIILNKIKSDPEPEHVKAEELFIWSEIKKKCLNGRRTGLGITAEGDALAALNLKYGSEESIKTVEEIHKCQKLSSYQSSMEMAKELGAFPIWNWNKEKDSKFLLQIKKEDAALYDNISKYGRRNIGNLTIAPTGSVSILSQTTSGIEPLFTYGYTRRKKINPNDKNGRVDFVDQNGDSWQEFTVYHNRINDWMKITGETDVSKSPWAGCCANDISWVNRVKLQAAAQRHIDHAISSTINLPETVTEEKVAEIYETSWRENLKGITVYRDNCRTGVLVSKEEKKKENKINHNNAPKRPQVLDADVHHLSYQNNRYYVVVGLLEKDPYEIFIGLNNDGEGDVVIPKSIKSGSLAKEGKGKYVLKTEDFSCVLKNTHTDENADVLARMLSSALRHGCSIEFLTHQLEKTKGGLTSFSKILSRAIKKYIKDGVVVSGEACPECGGKLVRESGCKICKGTEEKAGCGWTACN